MLRVSLWSCALLLLLVGACASESSETDAATPDAAGERDAGFPDAGSEADAGLPDAGHDADVGPSPDAGSGPIQAVLDARCSYYERIGLITVSGEGGGPRYLYLQLQDRPAPWWGPPTTEDAACQFHRASQIACSCTGDQVCDDEGICVDPPVFAPTASIILRGAVGTQTFNGDGAGNLSGQVTISDEAIRLELLAGEIEIETPPMSIPPALIGASGTLTGDYDNPQAVDLSWTAPADAAHVYSHTNINHHVFEPTFTTCVVPASAGSLHIDGAMLQPLAVATGLEFQAIEHIRFAAAQTSLGCVEIRFTRPQYVNL